MPRSLNWLFRVSCSFDIYSSPFAEEMLSWSSGLGVRKGLERGFAERKGFWGLEEESFCAGIDC